MCARTLVHIPRYMGRTSNNNSKRCQLWVHSMFCHVSLYRALLRIFSFMIIILYMFISAFYLYSIPLVSCSYLIILWVFPTWYDSDLSIHVCLPMLAIWLSHHHSPGSSDSSGSSCPGFGAWSVWILPVADQSGAAVAWISSRPSRAPSFQASCSALEFSCYDSEPLFVLFILIHLLYSRICVISVM